MTTLLDATFTHLTSSDLDDATNRAILADALEEAGRDTEAALCRGKASLCVVSGVLWDAVTASRKLNNLRAAAAPVQLYQRRFNPSGAGHRIDHIVSSVALQARQFAWQAFLRHMPQARRLELRAAATEGREASSRSNASDWDDWSGNHLGTPLEEFAVRLAWPEILAWIAADDARRLAEYEAFRAAILGTPIP